MRWSIRSSPGARRVHTHIARVGGPSEPGLRPPAAGPPRRGSRQVSTRTSLIPSGQSRSVPEVDPAAVYRQLPHGHRGRRGVAFVGFGACQMARSGSRRGARSCAPGLGGCAGYPARPAAGALAQLDAAQLQQQTRRRGKIVHQQGLDPGEVLPRSGRAGAARPPERGTDAAAVRRYRHGGAPIRLAASLQRHQGSPCSMLLTNPGFKATSAGRLGLDPGPPPSLEPSRRPGGLGSAMAAAPHTQARQHHQRGGACDLDDSRAPR